MKVKLIKYFTKGGFVTFYENQTIYTDWLGLHFLQGEREVDSILDFFDADDGIQFERYLVLRNMSLGFRVYDLEEKKQISEIRLSQEELPTEECYLIKDGMLYIASGSMRSLFSDAILPKSENKEENFNTIEVFSLMTGEKMESIETSYAFVRIIYIPSREQILLIGCDEHLYYLDEKTKTVLPFDEILYDLNDMEYNRYTDEIYILRGLGIRVYDSHFMEKNKIDFISDEKVESLPFMKLRMWPMEEDDKMMKESVVSVLTLDCNHVVVLTNTDRGSIFNLSIYEMTKGEQVASMEFPNSIEDIHVIDEKHISFLMKGTVHILEVTE